MKRKQTKKTQPSSNYGIKLTAKNKVKLQLRNHNHIIHKVQLQIQGVHNLKTQLPHTLEQTTKLNIF